jgi:2-hydroxy-3-oxopropionate reductase
VTAGRAGTASTIAFVGMGIMGAPMAINLARAGYDVVGLATSHSIDRLLAAGGRKADTIAAVMSEADVVITMLPDGPDVESVALGARGIYATSRPGVLHIDCSTIRPDVATHLAEVGRACGIRVIDAPVSGGEQGAIDANLSIMVGGDPEDVSRADPILRSMGRTVVRVGQNGAGQTVKAANQLIVAGTLELLAEAIVFLEAHDVDPAVALTVLGGGLAGSTILARKGEAMVGRQFTPGFRVELHHKDMGIVLSAARQTRVAIPLGTHVADLLSSLRAQGYGDLDHSALLKQVELLSGRALERMTADSRPDSALPARDRADPGPRSRRTG